MYMSLSLYTFLTSITCVVNKTNKKLLESTLTCLFLHSLVTETTFSRNIEEDASPELH